MEMDIKLNEIHVGQEIKKRLEELHMTKTEFGRQIGVPQQHINRILERETMETKKLVLVSKVLEKNFFALFCDISGITINSSFSAIGLKNKGSVQNVISDAILAEKYNSALEKIKTLENDVAMLKDANAQLKSQLKDKDELIGLYKNK
jgi:transcriptional regulator with XRE-family HTH domain